ncbi:MAG: hypothetical protein WBF64_06200, partial [Xanthobacteraceae bacterium]
MTANSLRKTPPYGKDRPVFSARIRRRKGRRVRCRSSVVEHSLGKGVVLSKIKYLDESLATVATVIG